MADDPTAELLEHLYGELRGLAARRMAREAPGRTLQPTALVHEVALRLLAEEKGGWEDRTQFFAAAALTMRRILVEEARRRRSLKRGGDRWRVPLPEVGSGHEADPDEIVDLDEALTTLEGVDASMAQVVQLRYFGGLTVEESAAVMGVSPRTVKRDWEAARLWLFRRIREARGEGGDAP